MNTLIIDFHSILKPDQILTNGNLADRHHHIWAMDKSINVVAMLLPESTEQVSEIMKVCDQYNQPVVVFGGLTNLVGSTEVKPKDVVISMERLDDIGNVDVQGRTITTGAGEILENVQNTVLDSGLLFPLNYGAKGSAQIGGAISTNAGGLQVLRYGMTRN